MKKKKARNMVRTKFEERYKSGKNRWFFQKLKFWAALDPQLSLYGLVCWNEKGPSIWALILKPETPRAHMFQSSGVRPQNDQGNQLLWKAAQQDAHNLQEMWNGICHFHPRCKVNSNLLHRLLSTFRRRLAPLAASLQLRSGDTIGPSRWWTGDFIQN